MMNGISLAAVQSVLSSSAVSSLAPNLLGVRQDIANSSAAQKLMASDTSELGAFLRLVMDAGGGKEVDSDLESLPVELRKELDSLDDASLEELVAILMSLRDVLADALPAPSVASEEGVADLSAMLTGVVGDRQAVVGAGASDVGVTAEELLAMLERVRASMQARAGNVPTGGAVSTSDAAAEFVSEILGVATDGDESLAALSTLSLMDLVGSETTSVGSAGEAVAGTAERSALPDLIYLPVVLKSQTGRTSGGVERIELVSLKDLGETDPVEALQDVVRRVEEALRERTTESGGETRVLSGNMEAFVSDRLGLSQSMTTVQVMSDASSDRAWLAGEAVRQAQAAIADMAERRMAGDVRVDSEGMRAVMHLQPPVLGRVHIELQVDSANRVQVSVGADQQDTQDFLRDNQEDLRDGLAQQGFDRGQIELSFDEEGAENFGQWLSAAPGVAAV